MRHLSVGRGFLPLLASALLCSCATTRGATDDPEAAAMDHFLDTEAPSLVCDGTRVVGATSFSPTCLPVEGPSRLTVTGLEPMSEPLRACVLTSLPVETGSTAPLACPQGAAQVGGRVVGRPARDDGVGKDLRAGLLGSVGGIDGASLLDAFEYAQQLLGRDVRHGALT